MRGVTIYLHRSIEVIPDTHHWHSSEVELQQRFFEGLVLGGLCQGSIVEGEGRLILDP